MTYNHTDTVLPLGLLLIPYGPLPPSDASKTIYDIPFDGYRNDFQLKYPAGTQFIDLVNAILLHCPYHAASYAYISGLLATFVPYFLTDELQYHRIPFVVVISFFTLSHLSGL